MYEFEHLVVSFYPKYNKINSEISYRNILQLCVVKLAKIGTGLFIALLLLFYIIYMGLLLYCNTFLVGYSMAKLIRYLLIHFYYILCR